MASPELRKRAFFLIVFVGLAILALTLLPFVQSWLQTTILPPFGMIFESGWTLTAESAKNAMFVTYAGVFDGLFRILTILIAMAIVIAIVRFIAFLILRSVLRGSAQPETSSLLKTVLSIIVYIVAFFIIFESQYPDVPLSGIFTGSTILGIVVGLALQDTLGNLFAGIAMQADQPFVVGDVVKINAREAGTVEAVSWRGVKIRTFQNKVLVISNSVLGKEIFEVAPKANLNARLVFFSTLYGESPANTAHIVREAIKGGENISQKTRPVVRIRNLGDSGVEWEVKYWLEDYTLHNDTDAMIRERIWYAFQRDGIEFAFPTRTIHIQEATPEVDVEEEINTVTERLKRVPIFDPLSDEEIERLAKVSRSRVYAPGESIVKLGGEGNSMFVINSGKVSVEITGKRINELGENDYFGEMSLLTGQPRTASVIAMVETDVLQIRKNALKPVLESNPILVQSITDNIHERQVMLQAAGETGAVDEVEKKKGIIRSIRKFFGLRTPRTRSGS